MHPAGRLIFMQATADRSLFSIQIRRTPVIQSIRPAFQTLLQSKRSVVSLDSWSVVSVDTYTLTTRTTKAH